jgi:hypothetical protein
MINESDEINIGITSFDSDKMDVTLRGQATIDIGEEEPRLVRTNITIPIGLLNGLIKESI